MGRRSTRSTGRRPAVWLGGPGHLMDPGCAGPLQLLFAHLVNHILTQRVIGQAELLPPVGQQLVNLTHVGAQAHEVESGAKPRLLGQTKRSATNPFVKTGLHHPDLAHVGSQLAAARHIANAGVECVVNRVLQGRVRMLALLDALCPAVAHVGPKHTSQQKAGRHRLAFAHPTVGVFQGRIDKRLPGPLYHHVQQGIDAARQAEQLELVDRGQRVPGLQ